MTSLEGRVAANVRYASYYDEEDSTFVVHFIGLGLIARDPSEDQALKRCKRLFNKFVRAYRSVGQLEQRLNQAAVEWWWEDKYLTSSQPPEDTDLLVAPAIIPRDLVLQAAEAGQREREAYSPQRVAA